MRVHKSLKSPMQIIALLALTVGLLTGAGWASGNPALAQSPGGLFRATSVRGALQPDYAPAVIRGRYVRIDLAPLADGTGPGASSLTLNLFTDVTLTAVRYDVQPGTGGRIVWLGRIQGDPLSQVTLVSGDGIMTGNITLSNATYQVRFAGNGVHAIYQVDPSISPPVSQPIEVSGQTVEVDKMQATQTSRIPVQIDVLVAWTPAARTAVGGEPAMRSRIDLAVAESNTAYSNSLANPRLRLVHAVETNYTEVSSSSTDLSRLRTTNDGFMDELHPLRNQYGADMVSLIFNNSSVCGQAYLMTTPSPGFATSAFSVVYWSCATGYYSFAHELGHNMGSHHDRANAGGQGSYPYSYGYQANTCNPRFRTVLAYDCPSGCQRLPYFSNPAVSYGGCPTGVSENAPDSANNALSLNNTAPVVAAWRAETVCSPGADYLVTQSAGASIVPGTSVVPGSQCNGCVVAIPLPFTYSFYGTPYTAVNASSMGNLQFVGSNATGANTCLPAGAINDSILAYWDNLNTNINDTMGIYTSVSGSTPNRIFNIEWRAGYIASDARANFEVRLYEGQPRFELVYGTVTTMGFSTTVGAQKGTGERVTQFTCNTANTIGPGKLLRFDQRACAGAPDRP